MNATEKKILCIVPEDEHESVSILTQNADNIGPPDTGSTFDSTNNKQLLINPIMAMTPIASRTDGTTQD